MATSGFDNTFIFLRHSADNARVGFESSGGYRPLTIPKVAEIKSFTEEELLKLFDRTDLEEKYADAVAADNTTNIHADMMVPQLKNDYVAGVHRDVFLRHTNRITRIIAESSRRINHVENVHDRRKEGMGKFEALKIPTSQINGGSS